MNMRHRSFFQVRSMAASAWAPVATGLLAVLCAMPMAARAQPATDSSTGLEASRPTTQPADFIPVPVAGTDAPPFAPLPGSGLRWKESAFGISFEVPTNADTGLRAAGDSLVAVAGPGGLYMIDFIIRNVDSQPEEFDFLSRGVDRNADVETQRYLPQQARLQFTATRGGIDINAVVAAAIKQMGDIRPTAVILDQRPAAIAKRPGAVVYFKIPADNPNDLGKLKGVVDRHGKMGTVRTSDWVLGQAFMMIDPMTVAIFQLDTEFAGFADSRAKFEGMLASVEKEPYSAIDARRKGLIERGDLLLKSLKPQQVHAAIVPEQWFRVVKDNNDVGWMRVNQKPDERARVPGTRVDVQYRIIQGDRAADMLGNYFTSDDGQTEFWSTKTAVRSAKERRASVTVNNARTGGEKREAPAGDNAPAWIETGIHAGGRITVTREAPASKEEVQFEQPGKGFLSSVMGMLLPDLLPREASGEWGFYAYDPRSGAVAFRTERVESLKDGSRRIFTRASPASPEQITEFGPDGKLRRRSLAGGLMLVPATKAQIGAIWNVPIK